MPYPQNTIADPLSELVEPHEDERYRLAAERLGSELREIARVAVLEAYSQGVGEEFQREADPLVGEALRTGTEAIAAAHESARSWLDDGLEFVIRHAARVIDRLAQACQRLFRLPLPMALEAALAAASALSSAILVNLLGGW